MELVQEFEKRIKQKITYMNSKELYNVLSKEYKINQSDAIALALKITDDEYCEKNANLVSDNIVTDLIYLDTDYIDTSKVGIGSDGFADYLELEERNM